MRDEDAVRGAIERCCNRCKSEVEVRGANRDENNSDVLDLDIQIVKVRAKDMPKHPQERHRRPQEINMVTKMVPRALQRAL